MIPLTLLALLLLGQDLPVSDGLELWLDAKTLPEGDVPAWHDASGKKHDLIAAESAPQRIPEGFVRFDGRLNRLRGTWGLDVDDLTLVVVFAAHSNAGGFSALFSAGAATANDYQSGLNVDFGAFGGDTLAGINVEGRGQPAQSNLLDHPAPLGALHLAALTSTVGKGATRLFFDGLPAGTRDRGPGTLRFDEVRLGARRYSNESPKPYDSGFFHGDIAEVLLFRRVLSDAELEKLTAYLRKKHPKAAVATPPEAVTMLSPGFRARKLPVQLTNINNVEYAPDGRLFALGYDGRVHVLTDRDGDGLEETVTTYYDGEGDLRAPIGMALAAEGLYVASKGKVSLIREKGSETVAEGWKEIPHGVDALGVALDPNGNLFFGLGCHDFTNIYRNYDLKSERGTILKVAPDRKSREIVCSGIRFPVALAFNRRGDLFATEQEGETWCPGGNPLDKLMHIQAGRHYAFPPRDPTRLPDVIDEPATVSFGPQHQSTCGLKFNEGRRFGPATWEGDALITGYSRGKLWRVPLAKTPAGYVGRNVQIASLSMLPVDVALAPNGDLLVSCHSGRPDWGTGPKGQGALYKIHYEGAPQPVAAWAAGPMEVRVAYDRSVELEEVRGVTFGEYVGAADRLEVFSPPYKAVEEQKRAPRYTLEVVGRALSEDRRTLLLTTRPHPSRASYALSLSRTELLYDLAGVEATWNGVGGGSWSGWLPHVDPAVVAAMLRGSSEHERFAALIEKPGRLKLKTKLELPGKEATLRFDSSGPLSIRCGGLTSQEALVVPMTPDGVDLEIEATTGAAFRLAASYHTDADPHERPIPLDRLRLAWAPTARPPKPLARGSAPELAGGDWTRGRALFYGDAKCSACHTVRGEGGKAGPDLSNLIHLDPQAVRRDIVEPNATINPDFASYRVELKDGQVLAGIVHTDGPGRIRLVGPNAEPVVIERSQIRDLRPSSISLMPEGFKQLGEERLKDLLTFLTQTEKPSPPQRSKADVEAVLSRTPRSEAAPRALKVLLVANPKDHGENEHDYPAWQKKWKPLLEKVAKTEVQTAFPWPTDEQWAAADLALLYLWGKWDEKQLKDIDAFLARGGGLVLLHSAVIPKEKPLELAARIGLAWEPGKTKFRHGPLELEFADHAITAGLPKAAFLDESYWPLVGDLKGGQVLATQVEEGAPRAMAWVREVDKGRVFCTLLGHYTWTFDDPYFRILVLRAMSWAAREPLNRFDAAIPNP